MLPKLKLRAQFEEILKDYKPSREAINTLGSLKIVLMMGLSGSGRNTLISELLKTGSYNFIVSDTTRKPRINNLVKEQDGVEYYFRNEVDFINDLKNGNFLEAAIIHEQQVSGISLREIKRATNNNKIAVVDIQLDGVNSILKIKPNTKCVFILPPSFDIWMSRLAERGKISKTELTRRLSSALDELSHLEVTNYAVIINSKLSNTVSLLRQVVEDDLELPYKDSKAERVANELKDGIKQFLQHN